MQAFFGSGICRTPATVRLFISLRYVIHENISVIMKDAIVQISESLHHNSSLHVGLISENQGVLNLEEIQLIENSSRRRRAEFIAGRTIAKALIPIGRVSVLRDGAGRPIWPTGYIGSISHKNQYCAVLVGSSTYQKSVGLDIEVFEVLEKGAWEVFTCDTELRQAPSDLSVGAFANLLFSAKEAVFKCASPIMGKNTPSIRDLFISVVTYSQKGFIDFNVLLGDSCIRGRIAFDTCDVISVASL